MKNVNFLQAESLAEAYRRLVAAARLAGGSAQLTDEERAQVDWTLSHIALSDRMLAQAARRVLAGEPARIDNSGAMDEAAIAGLIASTSHEQRVAMVSERAEDLVSLVRLMPPDQGSVSLQARLVNREGHVVFDDRLSWGDLVKARAEQQIPGHAARLEAFVR
jgi:hypothetical protein